MSPGFRIRGSVNRGISRRRSEKIRWDLVGIYTGVNQKKTWKSQESLEKSKKKWSRNWWVNSTAVLVYREGIWGSKWSIGVIKLGLDNPPFSSLILPAAPIQFGDFPASHVWLQGMWDLSRQPWEYHGNTPPSSPESIWFFFGDRTFLAQRRIRVLNMNGGWDQKPSWRWKPDRFSPRSFFSVHVHGLHWLTGW